MKQYKRGLIRWAVVIVLIVMGCWSNNPDKGWAEPSSGDSGPVTQLNTLRMDGRFAANDIYLYVASGNRVAVISYSDPYHPVMVGEGYTSHPMKDIQITEDGTRLLGVSETYPSMLILLDISTPASPRQIATATLPNNAGIGNILVSTNRLYVPSSSGLFIYNWDTGNLNLLGQTEERFFDSSKMFLEGTTLVLTYYANNTSTGHIQLIDVSDDTLDFDRAVYLPLVGSQH